MESEALNWNVLAVDDEPGLRALYSRALTGRVRPTARPEAASAAAGPAATIASVRPQFQLYLAASGAEAVALVEKLLQQGIRIAAAFFDIRMPGGIDGIETVRRIRALDSQVLCTVVSAYGEDRLDEINQIFAPDHLDDWDYLSKPFNVGEIMQKARNAVSAWNRRRAAERHLAEVQRVTQELANLNQTLDQKVRERTGELQQANANLARTNEELQTVLHQLQQTQTQLVQNAKMASLGQLAAGVAHEINNPIGFIHSNLTTLRRYTERMSEYVSQLEEWINSSTGSPDQVAEVRRAKKISLILSDLPNILNHSTDGTARVRQIVNDLRTFSRIDQEAMGFTDLNDTLRCAINLISGKIGEDLKLTTNYSEIPGVVGQSMELSQAFMNILLNAIDATSTGGEITVTTRPVASGVEIEFSDTGRGIAPEHLERIFDPFFTTKDIGSGVGLGLTVTYNIIKQHHGELRVQSQLGGGTTFFIQLPCADQPAAEIPQPQSAELSF